ncbi:hypothetical protein C8Q79DRAFT_927204 [Trametes meyenii]|nr:hypothetical protein C8Q79DRAFT_927204 [Trametes meyenii]
MPSFRRAGLDAQLANTIVLPPTQTLILDMYPEPTERTELTDRDTAANAELASFFQTFHAMLPGAAPAGGLGFVAPAYPPGEIDFSGVDFPEPLFDAQEDDTPRAGVDFAFITDAPFDAPAPHPAVASTSVGNVILAALAAEGIDYNFEVDYCDDMEVEELLDEEKEVEEDEETETEKTETEH